MDINNFKKEFSSYNGFRLATETDSMRILKWRNSEHVRHFMHNTDIILEENHQKWFSNILKSESNLYFIYEPNNQPIGLLCFNKITNNSAEWGFYLGEENLPKGTGTKMLGNAINLAFNHIQLKEITATVIDSNPRSDYLHKKLGFTLNNRIYSLLASSSK